MGTYEHGGVSTPAGSDGRRPPFWSVAGAVLAGLVWGFLWLLVLWFGCSLLGVIGQRGVAHPPSGLTNWLFPDSSAWATVANLTLFVGACGIVATFVRGAVARRTERSVSGVRVLMLVLLAGAVGLNSHGSFTHLAVVWLLLTLAVQRLAFVDTPWRLPLARRRTIVLAAAAAVIGLCVTTASYSVTHPLWFSSYLANDTTSTGTAQRVVFRVNSGGRFRYTFELHNAGFAPVSLLSVRAPGGGTLSPANFARLLGATASDAPLPAPFNTRRRPIAAATIPGRGDVWITLTMRATACVQVDQGPPPAALSHVVVNYRILGLNQSQTIPLDAPPAVLCRR